MKKIAVTAAALLLTSSLYAEQTQQISGVYVGAGLGLEAMPKHVDNGMGLSLKGGVALDQLLKNMGVEAELTTSLVAPEYQGGENIDVFTLGVYATYTIDIPNSRSIRSCTTSRWSRPRKPHRNPNPNAVDVSGSKCSAASFRRNFCNASRKCS